MRCMYVHMRSKKRLVRLYEMPTPHDAHYKSTNRHPTADAATITIK